MDIKRLLYKLPKMKEALKNARIAIITLESREKRYRVDENWYIRGSLPSNAVERDYILEEDILGKIEHLKWVMKEFEIIIDAIERAASTLSEEQQELAKLRYFEGRTVVDICHRMNATERQYHYMHRIMIEDITACINPFSSLWTDEYIDQLIFSTYGTMMERGKKVHSYL
jgi:DNA-directed RNA polymerase specialized sigma subunit